MGTETRYLKIEWPEYQYFLGRTDIYYCADDDTYFIPEDVYENDEYSDEYLNEIKLNDVN